MQSLLIRLIHVYRRILSPIIGQQCRFHPTCSRYAEQAIELYGPWRGGWMTIKRIARCQPLCKGGHDPVPGNEDLDADGCRSKIGGKIGEKTGEKNSPA